MECLLLDTKFLDVQHEEEHWMPLSVLTRAVHATSFHSALLRAVYNRLDIQRFSQIIPPLPKMVLRLRPTDGR